VRFIKAWNEEHGTRWVTSGSHYKVYQWNIYAPHLDQSDATYQKCLEAVLTMIANYLPAAVADRYEKERSLSPVLSDSSHEARPNPTITTEAEEKQRKGALRFIALEAAKDEKKQEEMEESSAASSTGRCLQFYPLQ
jgi:hypothetical protein